MKRKLPSEDFSVLKKQHLEANLLDFVCGLPGVGAHALECFTFPEQLKLKQVNKDLFRNSVPNMLEVVIENETQFHALQNEKQLQATIRTLHLAVDAKIPKEDYPSLKHVVVTSSDLYPYFCSDCPLQSFSFTSFFRYFTDPNIQLLQPEHLQKLKIPSYLAKDLLPGATNLTDLCVTTSSEESCLTHLATNSLVRLECYSDQFQASSPAQLLQVETLVLRALYRSVTFPPMPALHTLICSGCITNTIPATVRKFVWKQALVEQFQTFHVHPQVEEVEVEFHSCQEVLSMAAFPNAHTWRFSIDDSNNIQLSCTPSVRHCSLVLKSRNNKSCHVQVFKDAALQSFQVHVQHFFPELGSSCKNTEPVVQLTAWKEVQHTITFSDRLPSLVLTSNQMDTFDVHGTVMVANNTAENLSKLCTTMETQLELWCRQYRKNLLDFKEANDDFHENNDDLERQVESVQQHVLAMGANCQQQYQKVLLKLQNMDEIPSWFELSFKKDTILSGMERIQHRFMANRTLYEPKKFSLEQRRQWNDLFEEMKVSFEHLMQQLDQEQVVLLPPFEKALALYQVLERLFNLYRAFQETFHHHALRKQCLQHHAALKQMLKNLQEQKQFLLGEEVQEYLHGTASFLHQLQLLPVVQHQYCSPTLFSFDLNPSFP